MTLAKVHVQVILLRRSGGTAPDFTEHSLLPPYFPREGRSPFSPMPI